MEVEVRRLSDPRELEEAVEVLRGAWGMKDYREAPPVHLLRALADNGGLVLGAFVEGRMAGASYGWRVDHDGYFYSHATGVAPWAKYRGVGYRIKLEQRRVVLEEMGLRLAKWTFDPLQPLNSRFNLSKLGVIVREYLTDYYGEIRDEINRGLGSDRARAEWHLDSPRVESRLSSRVSDLEACRRLEELGASRILEARGSPPRPGLLRLDAPGDIALVELPGSLEEARRAGLAGEWRRATRLAYSGLLARGYILVDSLRCGSGRVVNVLWRTSLERALAGPEPWRSPA